MANNRFEKVDLKNSNACLHIKLFSGSYNCESDRHKNVINNCCSSVTVTLNCKYWGRYAVRGK